MAKWEQQQVSYPFSIVTIITIVLLLLVGLLPATTTTWAADDAGKDREEKDKEDKDKDKDKDKDGGDDDGNGADGNGNNLDQTYDINLFVINYFPLTEDGMLDFEVVNEPFLEGLSHEQIRQRTEDITNNFVFFVGEATSYLGYADSSAPAALNYHIFDTVENLEAVPIDPDSPVADYADYEKIMNDHNICDLVDNQGVDEVLIWAYQGFPEIRLAISESKMSSSEFGDISNSFRLDDMPHCNNTYIVYTFNYARGTAEAIHAWGHQIEAELDAVDVDNIFRERWQGPNYPQTLDVDGRCGSVHNAPNARFEYDSFNPDPQPSDCLDWDPDGLGELSDISCENWGCVDNSDTDNPALNYHVWNWQNLPGINNDKEFQGEQLRNWWDVHGDFENVMTNSRRLTVN